MTPEGDHAFQERLERFPQTLSMAIRDEITLRKGLIVFEAEIVWADECVRKLEELKSKEAI